jgi:phosphoribosylaminoimidazolecarboxamide formyltransferase/IMP cyclohydrolase
MSASESRPLALLSVTDKSGIVEFARGLVDLGYTVLSTGGTASALRAAAIPVTDVSDYTGSPEILDGRVKTLHPKVHGAILHDRSNPSHLRTVEETGIGAIDMVVVNLYKFGDEAVHKRLSAEDAIHHIDIGGPTMLRAAAKNWQHVASVIDPADYGEVLSHLRAGGLTATLRKKLAAKTFSQIAKYDAMIGQFLAEDSETDELPAECQVKLTKVTGLRYGENPQQKAALYQIGAEAQGFAALDFVQGKELSYNNILDLDAATALASEFEAPAAVIIKHTNPCGVAWDSTGTESLATIFERAKASDPKSAFGGIIAANRPVDGAAAKAMTSFFVECIAAPEFSPEALTILASKPNIRVIRAPFAKYCDQNARRRETWVRSVRGGLLVQSADQAVPSPSYWQVVTRRKPSPAEMQDLFFAMTIAKHVKSNAIVFARDGITVGVGAGQMSRIDSAQIAIAKARDEGRTVEGSVMASDAFFPFGDTVAFAASHGVKAIIQPGGSKRDQESIDGADAAGMAMVFTGQRHFRH